MSKGSFDKLFFLLVFVLEAEIDQRVGQRSIGCGPKKNGGAGKAFVHGGRFHGYACREVLSEKFQVSTEAFATDVQSCRHAVATGDGEHLPGLGVPVSKHRDGRGNFGGEAMGFDSIDVPWTSLAQMIRDPKQIFAILGESVSKKTVRPV